MITIHCDTNHGNYLIKKKEIFKKNPLIENSENLNFSF